MDEQSLEIVQRIEKSDKIAYNLKNAAAVVDLSYSSLRREIKRRKIFPTATLRLITKWELIRYLKEEEQLARRVSQNSSRPRRMPTEEAKTAAESYSANELLIFKDVHLDGFLERDANLSGRVPSSKVNLTSEDWDAFLDKKNWERFLNQ